jgi:tRNA(Ile)-lysidine synthase
MKDKVRFCIDREGILDPGDLVIVGVSGGADSICLVHLLKKLGYQIIIAHLNHGLRQEANLDEVSVRTLATALELPIEISHVNVLEYSKQYSISIEEAARDLRYRFLFSLTEKSDAKAVAVGHNADDQVETVLMHLLRGAGLAGMRGMRCRSIIPSWSDQIPLVRPLLSIWRHDILRYCEKNHLKPVHDHSNLDTTFFRNRIRHELIPFLMSYNPKIKEIIWRMASSMAGDYEVLSQVVRNARDACVIEEGEGWKLISTDHFSAFPRSIKRNLLRRITHEMKPDFRDLDYGTVDRAVGFIENPPKQKIQELKAGLSLFLEINQFYLVSTAVDFISTRWPQISSGAQSIIDVPGTFHLAKKWTLHATLLDFDEGVYKMAIENTDLFQAWIDMNLINFPLIVHKRNPGERFQPFGMKGRSTKVADFFINVKMPVWTRENWPLIFSGDDVVWVPGYRIGHGFGLTQNTIKVIHLHLFREDYK